jgi:hypothetical protein
MKNDKNIVSHMHNVSVHNSLLGMKKMKKIIIYVEEEL